MEVSIEIKIYLFLGTLVLTLLVFWLLVYRRHSKIHKSLDGQSSWNRHIGTFLVIFGVIIAEYQLIFNDSIDIGVLALILGYGVGGKIVNSKLNETKNIKNGTTDGGKEISN